MGQVYRATDTSLSREVAIKILPDAFAADPERMARFEREASLGRGGSWGEDGNIIAALSGTASLSRIPSAGGPPTPLIDLQNGELTHRWPQILPRGKAVLFTAHTATNGFDRANIK